jgi:toluene monooxygenase system ferredoxin subunit
VFGWAAMTPSCNHRLATASCVTPCAFLSINGERLIALMEQDHTLGYRLMTQLSSLITGTLSAFAGG